VIWLTPFIVLVAGYEGPDTLQGGTGKGPQTIETQSPVECPIAILATTSPLTYSDA